MSDGRNTTRDELSASPDNVLAALRQRIAEREQRLAARDAEIAALVETLRLAQSAHRTLGCRCGNCLRCKAAKAVDDALAPYKCLCDGFHEVFDDPSAPCPVCTTKEAPAH